MTKNMSDNIKMRDGFRNMGKNSVKCADDKQFG